ncbi:c-type cytochrome [Mesobacterium pallidum]|uniref:c-type cytochrome n=1 Tax=Mesobacterium pallidum TaxID=2872037 RepID=UPI001EE20F35|nr:c-type cytochrome [Mesobacterium pallidum]
MKRIVLAFSALGMLVGTTAYADGSNQHMMTSGDMMAPGLMMPTMNAARGRELFASKGCVVCHSVNGVGGEDAPMLDAEFMDDVMNPFEFAARMWRGAGAMVALQEDELGGQIDLTGEELANITAFVHDAEEQRKFSMADVPHEIEEMMHHQGEDDHHEEDEEDDH